MSENKRFSILDLNTILLHIREGCNNAANAGGDIAYNVATDLIDEELHCKKCGKKGLNGVFDKPEKLWCEKCKPMPCPHWGCDEDTILTEHKESNYEVYSCPTHGTFRVDIHS